MNKKNKKKGFTLVELIAVIAIIGILAAVLVPKVTGYLSEAKKIQVVDEARKVVTAAESLRLKGAKLTDATVSEIATNSGGLLDISDFDWIKGTDSLEKCEQIVDTENYTFTINTSAKTVGTPSKIDKE